MVSRRMSMKSGRLSRCRLTSRTAVGAQAMYKIRPNTIINYLMAAIRRNPNITDSELRQLPKCVRMQKENNYYIKDVQLNLIRKWMDDPDYIPDIGGS